MLWSAKFWVRRQLWESVCLATIQKGKNTVRQNKRFQCLIDTPMQRWIAPTQNLSYVLSENSVERLNGDSWAKKVKIFVLTVAYIRLGFCCSLLRNNVCRNLIKKKGLRSRQSRNRRVRVAVRVVGEIRRRSSLDAGVGWDYLRSPVEVDQQ